MKPDFKIMAGQKGANVTLGDDDHAAVAMLSPPPEKTSHPGGSDPIG